MAGADGVTVYNADGSKSIQVERSALKEAVSNGWKIAKPQSQPNPAGGALPQKGGFGTGTVGPTKIPDMKFGQGYSAGFNPMHMAPPGTPPMGGTVGNAVASGFNIPEISQRIKQKNYSGAAGEALGTASGAMMQFGGAEAKAAGMAGRAATDVSRAAKAVIMGADMAGEYKLSPEVARFSARYIQPLREALDKQYEVVHQALNGKAVQFNNKAVRLINSLSESEVPAIKRFAEDLMEKGPEVTKSVTKETAAGQATSKAETGAEDVTKKQVQKAGKGKTVTSHEVEGSSEKATDTTASKEVAREITKQTLKQPVKAGMWYEDARQLKKDIQAMISDADRMMASRYTSKLNALSNEVDNEIEKLANSAGIGDLYTKTNRQYKKMVDIAKTVASGASTTEGKVRPVADAIGGIGPEANIGGVRVGFRSSSGKAMKVPKEAQFEAEKLGKQLGVKPKDLQVGPGALEKAGKGAQAAGVGLDMGKIAKMIMVLMQGKQQDPYAGQQAQ